MASGSSNILRNVPSVRCATGDLLAQCCFCASQQSSNLTCADPDGLCHLGVAQSAGPEHEHGGRLGGESAECLSHHSAVLAVLQLALRVDGAGALFGRLRKLTSLAALATTHTVQRLVDRGS